jgi:AP-4 complex subunit epsilon-1
MSASGNHLSKELFNLVKAIGECRSKQEEDRIIVKEVDALKTKVGLPGVTAKDMKEYLIRAIYIEMLGHDASFAYIHSINLAQSNKLQSKRVGYLTASLCLSPESQMLILLVATLQRDLKSPNYLERAAALIAISRLVNPGLVHALLDPVLQHHAPPVPPSHERSAYPEPMNTKRRS